MQHPTTNTIIQNTFQSDSKTPSHSLNVVLTKKQTKKDLMSFFHACCFSPTKSTFLQAIKNGNFATWPELTYENVSKYLEIPVTTAKVHLNQERQSHKFHNPNQHLYKLIQIFFPHQKKEITRTNNVLASLVPFKEKNTAYSDLTGRPPTSPPEATKTY